ncbi:MAG: hypothetical protein U1A78_36205 [Polyangia bacterium]
MRRAASGLGLLLGIGLSVSGSEGAARAQAGAEPQAPAAPTATELDRAALQGAMRSYFYGEKWQGPWFMGAGAISIAAGAGLVAQDSDFMRGTSYPLFAVGAIQLIAGAVIFFRSDGQLAKLSRGLAHNPAEYRSSEDRRIRLVHASELRRIRRVNLEFELVTILESLILVGGVATASVGAARHDDVVKGVGVGLVIESVAMLALDLVAARRALLYTRRLEQLGIGTTLLSTPGSAAPSGFLLSASGRF